MTDEALVARAVVGDVDAYAALAERYYGSVRASRGACCAMMPTRKTSCRRRFFGRSSDQPLDRDREFRVWLFTILVNQCRTAATSGSAAASVLR
jgi:hypothetical protein